MEAPKSADATERRSKTTLTGNGGGRTTKPPKGPAMLDAPKKTKSPSAPLSSNKRTSSCASNWPIWKTRRLNCAAWFITVKLNLGLLCPIGILCCPTPFVQIACEMVDCLVFSFLEFNFLFNTGLMCPRTYRANGFLIFDYIISPNLTL